MSYYQYHVFFCTNQRQNGKKCCFDADALRLRGYVKDRIEALGLNKGNKNRDENPNVKLGIRINTAGCMDRCAEGPVLVVYPDGIWYTYRTEQDLDEIIDSHLLQGKVVERLKI